MFRPGPRPVRAFALLSAMTVLSACGTSGTVNPAVPVGTMVESPTPPPLTAGPPDESEVPPGYDETPDGLSPTPDADLPEAALTSLLRTRSSAVGGEESCGPAEVRVGLVGFDAATGHRYTTLVVTNTSSRGCSVEGVPGLGARGELGRRLTLTVERGIPDNPSAGPVTLAPGAEAQALMEWTGDLAAQDAERASMLVVQLAPGQVPVRVAARITDVPAGEGELDVGMFSTMRLGPFEPRRVIAMNGGRPGEPVVDGRPQRR